MTKRLDSLPVRIQSVRISDRTIWTFVELRDGGMAGIGEATLEGRTPEVESALSRFGTALTGASDGLTEAGLDQIRTWLQSATSSIVEATALSALEQALQDLIARRRGVSIRDRLGRSLRTTIPLYANINRGTVPRTPESFARRALRAAGQGFRAIKLAPFDGVTPQTCASGEASVLIDAGLARIAAVRAALIEQAPDCELMVDCHWRFNDSTARQMIGELAALGVRWYECPVVESPEHFALLRALRSLSNDAGMQLAGAETMIGVQGFLPLLVAGAYDVVMPDVKHAGGLAETLRIAEVAARYQTACSPHNPTGPICHAHSLQVAALIDDMPALEIQFEESERFFTLADDGLPVFNRGTSALPLGPGLGTRCRFDETGVGLA